MVCEATKPDIVRIVETWLDDRVSDSELSLDNYQLFRFDCNRHGGGPSSTTFQYTFQNATCLCNRYNFSMSKMYRCTCGSA